MSTEIDSTPSQPDALADLFFCCVLSCTDDVASKVDLCTPLTRTRELELVAYFRSWRTQTDKSVPDTALQGSAAEQAATAETQRCLCWLLLISLLRHDPVFGSQCTVRIVLQALQKLRDGNSARSARGLLGHSSELVLAAVGKSVVRLAAEAACRGSLAEEDLSDLCTVLQLQLNYDRGSGPSVRPGTFQAMLCSEAATALLVTKLLASGTMYAEGITLLHGLLRKAAYLDSASRAQLELCGRLLRPNCQCAQQLVDMLPRAESILDTPQHMRMAVMVLSVLATMSEHPLSAPVLRAAKVLHKAFMWVSLGRMPPAHTHVLAQHLRTTDDVADPAGQCLLLLSRVPEDAQAGARFHFDEAFNYLCADPGDRNFPAGSQVAAGVLKAALLHIDVEDIISIPALTMMKTFRSCWERFPELRAPIASLLGTQLAAHELVADHFPADKAAIWTELARMILDPGLRGEDLLAWLDLISFMSSLLALHGSRRAAAMRPILCSGEFFGACVRMINMLLAAMDDPRQDPDDQFRRRMRLAFKNLASMLRTILTERECEDPSVLPLFEVMAVRVFDRPAYSRDWLLDTITVAFHDLLAIMMAKMQDAPELGKGFATEARVRSAWGLLSAMVEDGILEEQLEMLQRTDSAAMQCRDKQPFMAVAAKIGVTAGLILTACELKMNLGSLELPHAARVSRALVDIPARALTSLPWSAQAVQLVLAAFKFSAACCDAELNAMLEAAACPDALMAADGCRLPPMRMHPALAVVRVMECALETIQGRPESQGGRTPVVTNGSTHVNRRSHKVQGARTQRSHTVEQGWMGRLAGTACHVLHWHWHHGPGAQQLLCEHQASALLRALLDYPALVLMKSEARDLALVQVAEMALQDLVRASAVAKTLLEEEAVAVAAPAASARGRKQKRQRARAMPRLHAATQEQASFVRQDSSNIQPALQDAAAHNATPGPAMAHPADQLQDAKCASCLGRSGPEAGGGAADQASSAQQACEAAAQRLGSPVETAASVGSAGLQLSDSIGELDTGQAANSWPGSAPGDFTSAQEPTGSAAAHARQASSWHACLRLDPEQLHEDLCCPITQELMQDPVIAADGHTYERSAIEAWLAKTGTSPMTGLHLEHGRLIPDVPLQHFLQKCRMCYGHDAG